jgi:GNAT superfamily N-acetyltransferase
MEATRFVDQYEAIAPLFGMTPADLRDRDDHQAQPLRRWMVVQAGSVVGAVTLWLRPDARLFLMFKVTTPAAYEPLTRAVDESLGCSLYTMVDESDREHAEALRVAGFRTEMVGERFRFRFDAALGYLRRAWVPTGYRLHSASEVDEARLLSLDNAIRNLVPGTDGWYGDADWFHDELSVSPPYDPDGYLVAVEASTDEYIGLVRVWRNPDGPRLGLVGVLPDHRSLPVGAALLRSALSAAADWGHKTFTTETSPSNARTHPRLVRLGAERMGRFAQLARATSVTK